MHTTPADAGELARTIAARTRVPGVTRVICPPFVCLAAVRDALAETDPDVAVGAQNVHHELQGAYTGEISAPMLAGLATGSSSATPSAAATPARPTSRSAGSSAAPWTPACARSCASGERLEEREAGDQDAVVERQLRGALDGHAAGDARRRPVW